MEKIKAETNCEQLLGGKPANSRIKTYHFQSGMGITLTREMDQMLEKQWKLFDKIAKK